MVWAVWCPTLDHWCAAAKGTATPRLPPQKDDVGRHGPTLRYGLTRYELPEASQVRRPEPKR